MGVEYAHYLLVRDPGLLGNIDAARRVHAVLEKWRLVGGEAELFSLEGGRRRKLRHRLSAIKQLPANLLVRSPHVDGGPAVAEVIGPSYYCDVDDDGRYFQRISIVIGTDFRIGPDSESLSIEVHRPPTHDGGDVIPYPDGSCLWEFDDSYPATVGTSLPETRREARGELPPRLHRRLAGGCYVGLREGSATDRWERFRGAGERAVSI